jgi:hypothetical protein
VVQLRAARRGVDRHDDRAEPRAPEHERHDLRPVLGQHGDAVPAADARRGEGPGAAGREVAHLAVRARDVADREQRGVPVRLGLTLEERRQRLPGGRDHRPVRPGERPAGGPVRP